MHALHFLLVAAEDAEDAASTAEDHVSGWGDEDNWFTVGGVASEDGSDDVENHGGGNWGLSYLDSDEGVPQGGTYFQRAVALVRQEIGDPVTLPHGACSAHPDLRSACTALADRLRAFDPERHEVGDLRKIRDDLNHVSYILDSRSASKSGKDVPEYCAGQFSEFGLTDLTGKLRGPGATSSSSTCTGRLRG